MSKKHHAPNKNRMAFAAGNPHIFEMFPPAKVPATAEYAGLTANSNRIPKNIPASLGAKAATHPGSTIITKTEANSQIHHFLFIYITISFCRAARCQKCCNVVPRAQQYCNCSNHLEETGTLLSTRMETSAIWMAPLTVPHSKYMLPSFHTSICCRSSSHGFFTPR